MYAVQEGLSVHKGDPVAKAYLNELMDKLQQVCVAVCLGVGMTFLVALKCSGASSCLAVQLSLTVYIGSYAVQSAEMSCLCIIHYQM